MTSAIATAVANGQNISNGATRVDNGTAAVTYTQSAGEDIEKTLLDTPSELPQETKQESVTNSTSLLSLQLNLDYTTAYFYHGIIQEDSGLILQPAAKLNVSLYESSDYKVDAFISVWNSTHGQRTSAQVQSEFMQYWYEFDLIGGVAVSRDKFTLVTQYVLITSPSDAYETVQETDIILTFDDSDLFGAYALNPYVILGLEIGADASDGGDSDPGTYLELGIAPGLEFQAGSYPISVTFPVSIGVSLHDYYQNEVSEDDTFGFAQIGAKVSMELPSSGRYGTWTVNAGLSALFLGDHTTDYNDGDSEELIAILGLQLEF